MDRGGAGFAIPPEDELRGLASNLADWAHPDTEVYLFGSRVGGDHRHTSDLDAAFRQTTMSDGLLAWWSSENRTGFTAIDSRLPGPLRILECDDPLAARVIAAGATAVHRDRNIICVRLPPNGRGTTGPR